MEPKPWEVDRFLSRPLDAALRIFVIYGQDTGLVRERGGVIAQQALGDDPDPMQLVHLTGDMIDEDPARLLDEIGQINMFGGQRVIRVTDAGRAAVTRIGEGLFDGPPPAALVIFEAGDLKPANKLRKLAAKSDMAALLACYPDNAQDLDRLVNDGLREAGLTADHDARAAITERMGPDRQSNRRMLEMLVTYRLGQSGPVTLADVEAALGDQSAVGFDAVAMAAFEGKTAHALGLFDKSVAEKTDPEAVIASFYRHLDRFDLVAGFQETGKSIDIAMKAVRLGPKDRVAAFRRQLTLWPPARLNTARRLTLDAQIEMHQGGSDSALICRNLILRIGTAASAGARRR